MLNTKGKPSEVLANWIDVRGISYVNFEVKSCSHAHVLLNNDPYEIEHSVYSIILGTGEENGQMKIEVSVTEKDGNSHTKVFTTDHVLECDYFVQYWLRWTSAGLVMGAGDTLNDLNDVIFHLEATTSDVEISSVHFASQLDGVDADWILSKSTGRLLVVVLQVSDSTCDFPDVFLSRSVCNLHHLQC